MSSSLRPPCEVCRIINRKCPSNCMVANYFVRDKEFLDWPLISRMYNIPTIENIINHLSINDKRLAIISLSIEAYERVHNPVYGSVSKLVEQQREIEQLRAQVVNLQYQLNSVTFPTVTRIPEVGEIPEVQSSALAQESEFSLEDWNTGAGRNCWEASTSSQPLDRGKKPEVVDLTGEGATSDPLNTTQLLENISPMGQTDDDLYPMFMPQNEEFKDLM